MSTLKLYYDETPHTLSQSSMCVIDNKVYQEIDQYRDIVNQEQLARIIEQLTIEKEFVLDSDRNNVITLTNQKNPDVVYNIYTSEGQLGINKKTFKLIGKLEL